MTNPLRLDPTRTTMLRRRFLADMARRFALLRKAHRELIVVEDAFGLKPKTYFNFASNQLVTNLLVANGRWQFLTDDEKLGEYQKWLKAQTDTKILSAVGGVTPSQPWTAEYIDSAYKKGLVNSYVETHKADLSRTTEYSLGSQAEFLRDSFGAGISEKQLRLLNMRTFTELKGVTATMDQQLSRSLSNGFVNGLGADAIARNMTKTISGIQRKRANVIARTEIVHAYNEAQLDGYDKLNVENVGVMAEWSTAGDDLVCDLCYPLEGVVLTIKEARGTIPRHPNCRCSWIPAFDDIKMKGQKRAKANVDIAIGKSLKAEVPKAEGLREARAASRWFGADKKPKGVGGTALPGKYTPKPKVPKPPKPPPKPVVKPKPKPTPKPKPKPKPIPRPTPKPKPKPKPMPEWKPTMTPDEAKDFTKGSKFKSNFYHGTTKPNEVKKTGLRLGVDEVNDFPGISVSQLKDYAAEYADDNLDNVLKVKVHVKKPFKVSPKFWQGVADDKESLAVYKHLKGSPRSASLGDLERAVQKAGYDATYRRNLAGKITELRLFSRESVVIVHDPLKAAKRAAAKAIAKRKVIEKRLAKLKIERAALAKKLAAEKAATEKLLAEKLAAEKLAAEKLAAAGGPPAHITFTGEATDFSREVWKAIGNGIETTDDALKVGAILRKETHKRRRLLAPNRVQRKVLARLQEKTHDLHSDMFYLRGQEYTDGRKLWQKANRELAKARKEIKGKVNEVALDVLKEVRDVGGVQLNYAASSTRTVKPLFDKAAERMPTDWSNRIKHRAFKVRKVSRGFYSQARSEIALSGAGEKSVTTAVHELTHAQQYANNKMNMLEKNFRRDRSVGHQLERINNAGPPPEVGYKGIFHDDYTSRKYSDNRVTELMTTGMEDLFGTGTSAGDYIGLDTEFEDFVFGLAAGM